MRNTLTKLDIINTALTITGTPLLKKLGDSTEIAQKVKLYYERRYQALLALFPWHFATLRRQLDRREEQGSKYRYRYRLPAEILYVWRIYPDKHDYIDYGVYYDASIIFTSYAYPLQTGSVVSSSIGEIIDGEIHSDFTQLYLFYTTSTEVDTAKFTQQFVTLMVNGLEMDLLKSKATAAEKLKLIDDMHRRDMEGQLKDQSIENKDSGKIPRASIVEKLSQLRNW